MKYFFIGIGGAGMSGLAQYLWGEGHEIVGSDRSMDRARSDESSKEFIRRGIQIVPQDGSGLKHGLDAVIYSGAVEKDNPDLLAAQRGSLPLLSRAEMLSKIFNSKKGIAISGTSGKTTVVGMIARILQETRLDFSMICGGKVKGLGPNGESVSWRCGKGDLMLVEADESDGSLVQYKPKISCITNISKDHNELIHLYPIFQQFLDSTEETAVLNRDCPCSQNLKSPTGKTRYFTLSQTQEMPFSLRVPGLHNIMNALAAIAVTQILGIPMEKIRKGLELFEGIARRLDKIGAGRGIEVYDDYSHNPAKIEAALSALQTSDNRLRVVFQPHGFGPLKLQWNDLADVFARMVRPQDRLFLLPIYDAGGTADRNISSEDFVEELKKRRIPASFISDRKTVLSALTRISHHISTATANSASSASSNSVGPTQPRCIGASYGLSRLPRIQSGLGGLVTKSSEKCGLAETAKTGDRIIVMGARDNSLTQLAYHILQALTEPLKRRKLT